MTPDDLAAIEARAEAATPGPWEAIPQDGRGGYKVLGPLELRSDGEVRVVISEWAGAFNALFLEQVRDDVPALIAEVRRLWALEADRVADANAEEGKR